MGCCLSSTTTTKTPKSDPNLVHGGAPPPPPPPPPLPPPLEEETVKEVLSETPIPKTIVRIENDIDEKVNLQDRVVEEAKVEPTAEIKQSEDIVSEVSEVISEMCSYSESLSAATEKRDDDGEVTQRVRRSPAKVTKRSPVRYPARRSEPSPVKRTYGQGRTMTTAEAARRNMGPSSAVGGSAGRSRSPATRGAAGQRRPVRYRSPSMIPAGNPVRRPPVEKAENSSKGEGMNGGVSTESLENPHVSLECFIFL